MHKFLSQVETKTRKLRKLFAKLQAVKQDITEVTEEHNRDRRDLEDTQEQLLKELNTAIAAVQRSKADGRARLVFRKLNIEKASGGNAI